MKRRYEGTAGKAAPSGGEAAFINGLGQLAPGHYTCEVSFITKYDTQTVLCLTTPTGDYHTETVKECPSWLHEGQHVSVHIGLTPGLVIVRDGHVYALMDAQSKVLQSRWTKSVVELRSMMAALGRRAAVPTILELRSGDKLYSFVKTKPFATPAPTGIDHRCGDQPGEDDNIPE